MSEEFQTNFTDITLAMDLSLSSPGFAVLAVFEGKPIVLEVSHIKTNAKKSHGFRIGQIAEEITRLIMLYSPKHYVREKGFSRFPATTQAIFKVVGVADYVSYIFGKFEGSAVEIAPTSVKKAVTGDGKASKEDVAFAVHSILQLEDKEFFANDDESDAAAVGVAFYKQKGMI